MNLKDVVNCDIQCCLQMNDTHSSDLQRRIHPDIDFCYNSINLVVGRRGSGKTFNVFRQLALLSRIPSLFHMIVYITNNKNNDQTYRKFQSLIKIPIKIVSYEESEEFLITLRTYKQRYDNVINGVEDNETNPQEILDFLCIDGFRYPYLFTVVLYDDALNVFQKKKSEEYRMIFDNRHNKISYFFCIQDASGISTDIKNNADSIWLFGGLSKQKFDHLMYQVHFSADRDEIWEFYKRINKQEAILADMLSDFVRFVDKDGNVIPFLKDDDGILPEEDY